MPGPTRKSPDPSQHLGRQASHESRYRCTYFGCAIFLNEVSPLTLISGWFGRLLQYCLDSTRAPIDANQLSILLTTTCRN